MATTANHDTGPAENEENEAQPWKVIDEGDLILVVGADETKIQVSSGFLKHISPVFRAMFNSNMSEGRAIRDRTGNDPVEVYLPADQPRAVLHALRAQYGTDPDSLNISTRIIRDVAMFVDKYDMVARFKPIGMIWLEMPPTTMDPPDRQAGWDLLAAAYWLDLSKPFYIMSQYFIRTNLPLLEYAVGLPDENLGLRLALAIEQIRLANAYRHEEVGVCLDCFTQATTSFVEKLPGCRYSGRHLW
ncbi:hypothetical protein FSARC_3893 [Fusarium sarcochroum]|uniref:BTB domain-containing protein n=1 Tax=Fusarium sarcochroum TaxID=1208366 RepID=A0A8H4XC44_9HYPO|nr:hypothetical protein FSARC_3893 [Fusarium sarcochroum]